MRFIRLDRIGSLVPKSVVSSLWVQVSTDTGMDLKTMGGKKFGGIYFLSNTGNAICALIPFSHFRFRIKLLFLLINEKLLELLWIVFVLPFLVDLRSIELPVMDRGLLFDMRYIP